MYNIIKNFIDVLFKTLGLVLMVGAIVIAAISFKACNDTMNIIDNKKQELDNAKHNKKDM